MSHLLSKAKWKWMDLIWRRVGVGK